MPAEAATHTASHVARYFAMQPLFPERVTHGNVPVARLTADGALSDSVELKSYAEVEPEPWVRRLLTDVDRVASHAFAVGSGAE